MHLIKNEHQIKFCFTYLSISGKKKNPDNNLRQEAGLFSLFSAVEYFQACPFFGFALGFWEMFLKGIS